MNYLNFLNLLEYAKTSKFYCYSSTEIFSSLDKSMYCVRLYIHKVLFALQCFSYRVGRAHRQQSLKLCKIDEKKTRTHTHTQR